MGVKLLGTWREGTNCSSKEPERKRGTEQNNSNKNNDNNNLLVVNTHTVALKGQQLVHLFFHFFTRECKDEHDFVRCSSHSLVVSQNYQLNQKAQSKTI